MPQKYIKKRVLRGVNQNPLKLKFLSEKHLEDDNLKKIEIVITKRAEEHVAKHNIRRNDLFTVLNRPYFVKRSGKRLELYGRTEAGRYLTLIEAVHQSIINSDTLS
jgi:hypothetical protein